MRRPCLALLLAASPLPASAAGAQRGVAPGSAAGDALGAAAQVPFQGFSQDVVRLELPGFGSAADSFNAGPVSPYASASIDVALGRPAVFVPAMEVSPRFLGVEAAARAADPEAESAVEEAPESALGRARGIAAAMADAEEGSGSPESAARGSLLIWEGAAPRAGRAARFDGGPFLPKHEMGIFQPGFIFSERDQPASLVFDLDESVAGIVLTDDGMRYDLRPEVVDALSALSRDWRLVLWTNQFKYVVRRVFEDHPRFGRLFSRVIAGDDFLGTVRTYLFPGFEKAYALASRAAVERFYQDHYQKDVSLFANRDPRRGYKLIVDDNEVLEALSRVAPFGPFRQYRPSKFIPGRPDPEPVRDWPSRLPALAAER